MRELALCIRSCAFVPLKLATNLQQTAINGWALYTIKRDSSKHANHVEGHYNENFAGKEKVLLTEQGKRGYFDNINVSGMLIRDIQKLKIFLRWDSLEQICLDFLSIYWKKKSTAGASEIGVTRGPDSKLPRDNFSPLDTIIIIIIRRPADSQRMTRVPAGLTDSVCGQLQGALVSIVFRQASFFFL